MKIGTELNIFVKISQMKPPLNVDAENINFPRPHMFRFTGFITMVMIITMDMFPSYLRLSVPGASDWPAGSAPQPIRGGKQMMKLIIHTRLISILVLNKQSQSECNNYHPETLRNKPRVGCWLCALLYQVCISIFYPFILLLHCLVKWDNCNLNMSWSWRR